MEKDKDEVRQRILAAAKELFVQQGYKKTTIRQIVEKSGVLTGSIYYFFKNKEDIFQSLVMELLRQCTDLIAAHFRQESPAFRYAALCLVEFEAVAMNQLVRETYYEGYTTPSSTSASPWTAKSTPPWSWIRLCSCWAFRPLRAMTSWLSSNSACRKSKPLPMR